MDSAAQIFFGEKSAALLDLQLRGARAAQALMDRKIDAGDVVAILMRNEPRFIEALTCIRCLNARRVLIPWHLTSAEIGPLLAALAPRILIVHRDLLPLVATTVGSPRTTIVVLDTPPEIARAFPASTTSQRPMGANIMEWESLIASAATALPVPLRDLDVISVTSGSTGSPKLIHWPSSPRWVQRANGRTGDRPPIHTSIVTAPLYHGGQYGAFSYVCQRAANQVILPKFDAEEFLHAVERFRVNHAYMVPTMFVRLLKLPRVVRERYDISSLNYVLHTGAPCPADIKRQMISWLGPVIWEAYGCSELSVIAASSSADWLARPGTVGKPVMPVRVLNAQGADCPPGEIGEIFVNVSGMPSPQYENGEVRQRVFEGDPWLAPGDSGYLDAAGYLYIAGRTDDLINNGRVKVYPLEIENAMLMHPAVRDCAIFALEDEEFGQVIGAAVEVQDDRLDMDSELRRFLGTRISEHKIPVVFMRMNRDIRNAAGKLNREQLRNRAAAAFAPSAL